MAKVRGAWRTVSKLGFLLGAVVAGGCTHSYQIGEGEPTAIVRFSAAWEGRWVLPTREPTKVLNLDPETCSNAGALVGLEPSNKYQASIVVPVGKPLYFKGELTALAIGHFYCDLVTGITPEAGSVYDMRFVINTDEKRCLVTINAQDANGKGKKVQLLPKPSTCEPSDKPA